MAEVIGLAGNLFPGAPAAVIGQVGVHDSRFVLGAKGGVFHQTANGQKQQVLFRQGNYFGFAVVAQSQAFGQLFVFTDDKLHVIHFGTVMELDAFAFQILHHGKNHGFILVVFGKAQSA